MLPFARIPSEILLDARLKLNDIRVYGVMAAHCTTGNVVHLGERRIAELAGVDRRTVRRAIEHLGKTGHLSRSIVALRSRSVFQLNSPVFRPQK